MSLDKKIETSEQIAPARMSDSSIKCPEKDVRKDGTPSEHISSVSSAHNAVSGIGGANQPLALVQGVYYLPTTYDFYYPGYNSPFPQSDDKGYFNSVGGPYTGIQPDTTSLLYYLPGYGPYTTGFVDLDGRQAYTSSKLLCSFRPEAFPHNTYDSTFATRFGSARSVMDPGGSGKSNGSNTAKTGNSLSSKTPALPSNPSIQQPASRFSRSVYQNQSLNSLNKLGSSDLTRGFHPTGKFSSFTNRNPGVFTQYSPVWNNSYRYKSRENFGRGGEIKARTESSRGPRADDRNNSFKLPSEVEQPPFANERKEFQTEYENAKLYVIKSYSEDDIHKCIKFNVWSSTPNGNKKLDAAFRDADAKTSETGVKCPVFLFFSVNGSGQFVGVAEMIGQVDFSKNMDFWQLDKWTGFFPVKWHIIKDVPNTCLRHIILENNENRPVTYSRDTQEIGLKQGLEMLRIFKNHSGKTSVLDDFGFYEKREKALKAKRNNATRASQTNGDHQKHSKVVAGKIGEKSAKTTQSGRPLVSLTE